MKNKFLINSIEIIGYIFLIVAIANLFGLISNVFRADNVNIFNIIMIYVPEVIKSFFYYLGSIVAIKFLKTLKKNE